MENGFAVSIFYLPLKCKGMRKQKKPQIFKISKKKCNIIFFGNILEKDDCPNLK